MRFHNSTDKFAFLSVTPMAIIQPQYGGGDDEAADPGNPKRRSRPASREASGATWVNIGPFCRLVHDEGCDADAARMPNRFRRRICSR